MFPGRKMMSYMHSDHEADRGVPYGVPRSSRIVQSRAVGFEERVVFRVV